jgi:predicted dehydrogenase
VITTKPFELDPAAALAVLRKAEGLGLPVHMNSPNARPQSDLAPILAHFADGTLGEPSFALASTWAVYEPEQPDGTWYDNPDLCPVAPVFRLGIYTLNSLSQIFGPARSVSAQSSRMYTQRPTADQGAISIVYESGALATVSSSFNMGGPDAHRDQISVGGRGGVAYLRIGPFSRDGYQQADLIISTPEALRTYPVTSRAGDYDWEFFYQRVTGQVKQDVLQPEQVVESIRIVEAMRRSEQSGKVEPVER